MKRFIYFFFLVFCFLFINGCLVFRVGEIMHVNNKIEKSSLSEENKIFEKESGIELIVVKRGLWSMHNYSKNKVIYSYYESLLNNTLIYLLNIDQKEFVQQSFINETIRIQFNNQFQEYTEYENAILLITATSALALLKDSSFNKNEISNKFFDFIKSYNENELKNIIEAQWYKNKNITITDNGIIIGQNIS